MVVTIVRLGSEDRGPLDRAPPGPSIEEGSPSSRDSLGKRPPVPFGVRALSPGECRIVAHVAECAAAAIAI